MLNDVIDELKRNFIEYAYAVNSDRAIPDATSGLKPVAKRILWSALEKGRTSNKPHVKAARIVGDVMGEYHPHGDSSIYGAMVRLSQPWTLRYPLIDWHGSNGNQIGDGPAAMRYTEARLSKLAEDGLLAGLKKKNVEFTMNYDETQEEPVTLPAIFPNLLCNPNTGIGVAMACNWMPHNLNEVAQAIYDYMDGKEPMLPGPDFPTGGIIINKNDIPAIMKTGHGSIKLRGKYKVEKNKIIFYEIPYGKTVEDILLEIKEVCEAKEIEGIKKAHDDTDKKGVKIIIECATGMNPDVIANKLFAKTSLQSSLSYNQIALIDKTPTELNLEDCIKVYINHNVSCLIKETQFDLDKAQKRLHIIEGLLIALDDIDNVIALIKNSESKSAARDALMKKYHLTEMQADAILDLKLSSLAKLEKEKLETEKIEVIKSIEYFKSILVSEKLQKDIVRSRLEEIVKKYGDARRTELAQIEVPKEEKEIKEVVPEDVIVVTTQTGLIKKIPTSEFKVQHRGGVGVKSNDDVIMSTIKTNTIDYMMFFTNNGKMYRCVVDNVPTGTNTAKGVPISNLVQLEQNEKVIAVTSLHRTSLPKYAIFITKNGLIKKTLLEEYMSAKRTGIKAINLKEGDSVASVIFQDDEQLVVLTKSGMGIRFETKLISATGRVTAGVKCVNKKDGDEIIAALPVHKMTDTIGIVMKNGLGKKIKIDDIPVTARGCKGVIVSKNEIAGAAMISDEDNLLISGPSSTIRITAKDIPLASRQAEGNIMTKINNVVSIAKI